MSEVAVISANVEGDIGGVGISRFHVERTDSGAITSVDCSAAAAAVHDMLQALELYFPSDITWVFPVVAQVIESTSGIIQAELTIVPAPGGVQGQMGGGYPAGNGARINWKTTTVLGRRFMRAANYMVPLGSQAYATTGALAPVLQSALIVAAQGLLTALSAANLQLVAYHRPAKGASSGGTVGPVTAVQVGSVPATLRSRRT